MHRGKFSCCNLLELRFSLQYSTMPAHAGSLSDPRFFGLERIQRHLPKLLLQFADFIGVGAEPVEQLLLALDPGTNQERSGLRAAVEYGRIHQLIDASQSIVAQTGH